jgi:predicted cobalt transporter CbtA
MTVFMTLALALTFAFVGVKDASADALLFPWITKSSTVSTLVSVVNTTNIDATAAADQLHYQYWYKQTTANTQTGATLLINRCWRHNPWWAICPDPRFQPISTPSPAAPAENHVSPI